MFALQGEEPLHVVVAELVAAAFLTWFAVEAVYLENTFELLAQAAVATCIAARVAFFMVSWHVTAVACGASCYMTL